MKSPIKITSGSEGKLLIQRGKKKAELTYQQVFALGHSFFVGGNFEEATDVFSVLARIKGRGPRARIMLARCKAEIESFEACSEVLHAIFDGELDPVAEDLQGAFVFHTMGMQDEAIAEMVKAIKEYPDFPTAFLYLGDLYLENSNHAKAVYCWKQAARRDRKGGAVAMSAKNQLKKLKERIKKSRSRSKKRISR